MRGPVGLGEASAGARPTPLWLVSCPFACSSRSNAVCGPFVMLRLRARSRASGQFLKTHGLDYGGIGLTVERWKLCQHRCPNGSLLGRVELVPRGLPAGTKLLL